MKTPGTLYIVSAPSGAGKTSLVRALAAADPMVTISVSHTTRPSRPGECDGVHYHFVSEQMFRNMREENAFLEYAEVFGHYYGTSGERLIEQVRGGLDVILEIDWQGARQVRKKIPTCINIFILPPSRDILMKRLRDRGQDDDLVIASRVQAASAESMHFDEFDYLIINDDFDKALSDLRAVLRAERLRQSRQAQRCSALIASLLG
uniref:Guanylate kinase n=1 Tax=Candidatus Kentrum sp. TUN TaxID=2126343 RepID=A0A451ATE6_9GAMM|nr:MAG: guanylate kinase [Candidatus Kentron sp. TUN]VFK69303.1 MAG: guanylate kinase [Candidatus Kentron sp. TUN]